MAYYSTQEQYNVTILVVLITLLASTTNTTSMSAAVPHSSLATRLKVDGEPSSANCWESLFQLQACTGEVIMFFLDGETYLGPSCCNAIRVVGHDCWPEMLGSLGFTPEEDDILQGYCDAEEHHHSFPPPSPPIMLPFATTKIVP